MPLVAVTWFLFSLASLAVWGAAGFFLWSWYDGAWVSSLDGVPVRDREEWRLWTGLGLLFWSLFGRFIVTPLIAKPDRRQRAFARGNGRIIKTEQGPIYVEERGDGNAPTIVLTHGQGLDSTLWKEMASELGKRFRVISWDLPGLGKSRAAQGFDPAGAARALQSVVRESQVQRVVLVGHSFGGMTIQELAKLDPGFFQKAVSGVVLLNTTYTNPLRTMILSAFFSAIQKPLLEPGSRLTIWLQPIAWLNLWQSYLSGWAHLANRIQFGKDVTRSLLEHATLVASRNPPASIERRNLGMFHWRGLERVNLGAPTLIIAGAIDIVTKREAGEEIERRLANSRLQVIERANHMGPFEQIEAYGAAVAAFAAEVQTRPAVEPVAH